MKLLILAGGYGTRLYPIVRDIPKALLEVAGKTLIDHTLEKFYSVKGIDEVFVVTNDKFYGVLTQWAKGKQDAPFALRVINDGTRTPEERLGAIGDILYVLKDIGGAEDLAVVGSDNLFDCSLSAFFAAAAAGHLSPMVGAYDLGDLSGASNYGVIELDGRNRIVSLEEKPKAPRSTLISMCLYFFPAPSLPLIQAFVDETGKTDTTGGYIQWLYKKTDVYGFKFSGKWYDIGSLESYAEAQKSFGK